MVTPSFSSSVEAQEGTCTVGGSGIAPGLVISRSRDGRFAARARKGAFVAMSMALCAAVAVVVSDSSGGAGRASLMWVRTSRRLFKTAESDYAPLQGFDAGMYRWGTRASHSDYSEHESYTPDDTSRHHWGTRDSPAHDDYADQVYGTPYTSNDRTPHHYGTRVHRDYGEGDVFSRFEPFSMPYGVRPPTHVISAGASHAGPPQPGGMRNVMRHPDVHPTWGEYMERYGGRARAFFAGPGREEVVSPPEDGGGGAERSGGGGGWLKVVPLERQGGGAGVDAEGRGGNPAHDFVEQPMGGEEGEEEAKQSKRGGHWVYASRIPKRVATANTDGGGHWEWRPPPTSRPALAPPPAPPTPEVRFIGFPSASAWPRPVPSAVGIPARAVSYIGGGSTAWPRSAVSRGAPVAVFLPRVPLPTHVTAGVNVGSTGWVESSSPFPILQGPPGVPGKRGAAGYRDTYVLQGPPGAPGLPGHPALSPPGGIIVGAQGRPGSDGPDGITVPRFFHAGSAAVTTTVVGYGQRVTDGVPWGYAPSGRGWDALSSEWRACSDAVRQSPIDIAPGGAVAEAGVQGPEWIFPAESTVNGLNGTLGEAQGAWEVTVRWAGEVYTLENVMPHTPSEHTVDGGHADLEVQYMLTSRSGGGTPKKLALAVMYLISLEAGGTAAEREGLSQLVAAMKGDAVGVRAAAKEALARVGRGGWWRYEGSLTTPPCTENVTWLVARSIRSAGAGEVGELSSMLGMSDRPTQPLGARVVSVVGVYDRASTV